MARYGGGVTVIEQESPFAALLGGIGQGVSRGVQRRERRADESQGIADKVLEQIMTGGLDPRNLTSQSGMAFLRQTGLDKHKGIMAAVEEARGLVDKELPRPNEPEGMEDVTMTPGGGLANTPKPVPGTQIEYPTDIVNKLVESQKLARISAAKDVERKIAMADQMTMLLYKDALDRNKKMTPQETVELGKSIGESMGVPVSEMTFSVDEENGIRITGTQASVAERSTAANQADIRQGRVANRAKGYTGLVAGVATKRANHLVRLQSALKGEQVTTTNDYIKEGMDPKVAAALSRATALLGGDKTKDRVLQNAEAVDIALKTINQIFEKENVAIHDYGVQLKDAAGRPLYDEKRIKADQVKPLTFEDIAGESKESFIKKRKSTPANKVISQVREDAPHGAAPQSFQSAKAAKSDSDKVTRVYDELKDTVQRAMESRPDLTSGEIHDQIVGMKEQIMAEYGLNDRLFSLILSMADKVMG